MTDFIDTSNLNVGNSWRHQSRFTINLAGASLITVLEEYKKFMNIDNPKYDNSTTIAIINSMQSHPNFGANEPYMANEVCSNFWKNFKLFILVVPGSNGEIRKMSTAKFYHSKVVAALTWASKFGCELDKTYNVCKFDEYHKTKIIPTDEQLNALYNMQFTDEVMKEVRDYARTKLVNGVSAYCAKTVRDTFVLACSLGQRISDIKRITPECFSEDKQIFKIVQQKTGAIAQVYIPKYCNNEKIVYEILEKYKYYCPCENIDTNRYNKILHCIAKASHIFDDVVITQNKINGVIVTEKRYGYECLTSHTARRKFVSDNLITKQIPIPNVIRCTGHKSADHLGAYTVISDYE